jgi:murein hydrolase activator
MPDMRRLLALLVTALCIQQPAVAQEIDKVESDLATTMQALKSADKERKALDQRRASLNRELEDLQNDLVSITGKIQRQEKLLSQLEANLLNLQDEEREKASNLLRRRREQEKMVQTMLRLSRVPPEMVIAMPGDFENTMRTSTVLGLTTTALAKQADILSHDLAEIHALQTQIKHNHRQLSRQKSALQKDEAVLAAKLDERGSIQSRLLSRYTEQEQQVQRLSDASNSLRDLMSQLETRRRDAEQKAQKLAVVPTFKPEQKAPATQGAAPTARQFAAARGKISLPAEGKIFTFYGDKTDDGDTSRGISIRTRSAAKVTSPYAAEVVYTGTFLDYGNMVILRHADGYHSLLAGMQTVSAKLGQNVIQGEPVGEMGRNEEQTALYMEIRKENRPIDPMPWLQAQQYANKP